MRVSCCLWWCMVLFMWTLLLWKRLGDRGWNITVWLTDLLDWGQCFPFWVVPGPMCGRSFLDGSARWSQLYSAALDPGVPAQQSPAKLIKKPIALHYRDFLFFFLLSIFFCFALPLVWLVVLPRPLLTAHINRIHYWPSHSSSILNGIHHRWLCQHIPHSSKKFSLQTGKTTNSINKTKNLK